MLPLANFDAPRKVVAWVLAKQMDSLCDRYDGDPMTVEASEALALQLRTTVRDALQFLSEPTPSAEARAVRLALDVINIAKPRGSG